MSFCKDVVHADFTPGDGARSPVITCIRTLETICKSGLTLCRAKGAVDVVPGSGTRVVDPAQPRNPGPA